MLIGRDRSNLTVALLRLTQFGPPRRKMLVLPSMIPPQAHCPQPQRPLALTPCAEPTPAPATPHKLPPLPPPEPPRLVLPMRQPRLAIDVTPANAWRTLGRRIDIFA